VPSITIRLDDDVEQRLKRHIATTGQSASSFVRAAVDDKLRSLSSTETPYEAWQRLSSDIAGSGDTDRSTTYKSRVKERLLPKHRR
jgi:predicted transcriptional regulator